MAQTIGRIETGHEGQIHDVQLDYYGRRLATAGHDGSVRIWDISNADRPQAVAELKGHQAPVWSVCWAHPKYPGVLASCGYDKQVLIWKDQQLAYKDEQARACVNQVAFAPFECGLVLASAGSDGNVGLLQYERDQWTRTTFLAHPCGVRALCWAPMGCFELGNGLEGAKIATGGLDAAVKVWIFKNGSWVREDVDMSSGAGHKDWVTGIAWRPYQGHRSDILASCSKDGTVVVWQRCDTIWRPVKLFREEFQGKPVWSVEFSQVGGMLQVNYGNSQMAIFKESSSGDFAQVLEMDERGIADPTTPAVNLEAFGEQDSSPAGIMG
ncbi:unnamed protein product [Amoebophrya sp. A120]|nr:unnamed protein product [Amoebophrya sp. A120]|eukprot:GSA120T00013041001.1